MRTEVNTSKWNWTPYLGQEMSSFSWPCMEYYRWNYSWDRLSSAEFFSLFCENIEL